MVFIYLLLKGHDWDDISIFMKEDDAIIASKNNPDFRVGIFNKDDNSVYISTNNYYKNGEYFEKKLKKNKNLKYLKNFYLFKKNNF